MLIHCVSRVSLECDCSWCYWWFFWAINSRGRHNGTTFILSCLRSVFSELPLHGRWLPAEQQLRLNLHMKFQIADDDESHQQGASTFKCGSEHHGNSGGFSASSFPICLSESDTLILFLGDSDHWSLMPSAPSKCNASSWEQDSDLTRLYLEAAAA